MSHIVNDVYLENARERFDELKDGNARVALLTDLRHQGFDSAADSLASEWYMERLDFLDDNNVSEKDVMMEERDQHHYKMEYYLVLEESGAPGDDYQVEYRKVYLPSYLNVDYWLSVK